MKEFLDSLLSRKFLLTLAAILLLVLDATKTISIDEATRNQLLIVVLGYDAANVGAKLLNK